MSARPAQDTLRAEFDVRWDQGSRHWQGGKIGLKDCVWVALLPMLGAAAAAPRDRFGQQQQLEDALQRFGAEGEEVTEIFDSFMQALRRRYEREARFAEIEHYAGVFRYWLARLS